MQEAKIRGCLCARLFNALQDPTSSPLGTPCCETLLLSQSIMPCAKITSKQQRQKATTFDMCTSFILLSVIFFVLTKTDTRKERESRARLKICDDFPLANRIIVILRLHPLLFIYPMFAFAISFFLQMNALLFRFFFSCTALRSQAETRSGERVGLHDMPSLAKIPAKTR